MIQYLKLGSLTRIRTGKLDANAADDNGKYPFFTCSKEPLSINTCSYDCECVLVAGNGDLNVKYYDGKFDAYQRTYIIESLDKTKLMVKYLYCFLDLYVEILRQQAIGGVIKYIKLGNLADAIIPVPVIEKQREIIEIFEKCNGTIAYRHQELLLMDQLVKSRFIEMFGDPVYNTLKLPTKPLSELGSLDRGRSKHRPRNDPRLLGGPYPLIQTGEVSNAGLYITGYQNTYSELGLKQSKMWKAGTLCITIAANIAQTAILTFDACFPDSVVGFIPTDEINIIYMHYWFSFFQKILDEQAPQVAQKNINLKILSELQVAIPSIEEQSDFATFVEQVDKSKFEIQQSLEKLEILKKSLMQQYFG